MAVNKHPNPNLTTIETERLIIRRWKIDDLNDFYEYVKEPAVMLRANLMPYPNRSEALQLLNLYIQSDEFWAIALKSTGQVLGQLKIYPDNNRGKYSQRNTAKFINYALAEKHWGNGYMTEALKAAVEFAFTEMNTEILTAFHFPENTASRRVLEKCGFRYETTLENGILGVDNKYHTAVYHSIMKDDYFNTGFKRFSSSKYK